MGKDKRVRPSDGLLNVGYEIRGKLARRTIQAGVERSKYLRLAPPMGALYAFVEVRSDAMPWFDDQSFALDLLATKHVLVAPGVSFNFGPRNFFRITNWPEPPVLATVFERIEELLAGRTAAAPAPQAVVPAGKVQTR